MVNDKRNGVIFFETALLYSFISLPLQLLFQIIDFNQG